MQKANRIDEAEVVYRQILEQQPNHPDALHLTGLIAFQKKEFDTAAELIRKAISMKPDAAVFHKNLGMIMQQRGSLAEAEKCLENAVRFDPNLSDARFSLAAIAQAKKDHETAVARYRELVTRYPTNDGAYNNMGNALQDLGRFDESIACYENAVRLNPENVRAFVNMGNALQNLERFDDALQSYRKAVQIDPRHTQARTAAGRMLIKQRRFGEAAAVFQEIIDREPENTAALEQLGIAYGMGKQLDAAIACFQELVKRNPDSAQAFYNLGIAVKDSGKLADAETLFRTAITLEPEYADAYAKLAVTRHERYGAEEALPLFRKALSLKTDSPEIWNEFGNALKSIGDIEQATNCYKRAVEINPAYAAGFYNLGNLCEEKRRFEDAIGYYEKALEVQPEDEMSFSSLLYLLQYVCDWDRMAVLAPRLDAFNREAIRNQRRTPETPLANITRCDDPAYNLETARSWAVFCSKPILETLGVFPHSRHKALDKDNRIAVGYLSNDFRDHPVGQLMLGLFRNHDRSNFRIHCYSFGRDDGSRHRSEIAKNCDCFADIRTMNSTDAVHTIYNDGLDILVDLMGHTSNNRMHLCAARPAPIQAAYLGFPGTTGADFFDYIITDQIVTPPDQERFYTEKFAFTPDCFMATDNQQAVAADLYRRIDFGLPENDVVFCSFNSSHKIEPVIFDAWIRILNQVPGSVLWLPGKIALAETAVRREAVKRGLDPERIVFTKRIKDKAGHLGRISLADIALDTRIYNGHATSSDILLAGVPLIALRGGHFASRVASSLLSALETTELIAETLQEYEAMAVHLGRDSQALAALRQKLRHKKSTAPLFDSKRFTRNLESLYRMMVHIFRSGETPRHIYL